MNILMNSSDNKVPDNGTIDGGAGFGGGNVDNWNGGSYSGNGYGSGWSVHGGGWPGPDFGVVPVSELGNSGGGFGLAGGGLANNDGSGS